MNFRLMRLQSDYEAVRRLAHLHGRIDVEGVSGKPPDRYRLVLAVRSLREKGDRIVIAKQHRLEVVLPRGYPRDAPVCRMLTPVFHPNIAPHAVCVGDHWSAAESLDVLIQRVGEMLAFQSYNIKSPLNGRAAQWVEMNERRLPIDAEEFFVDLATATPPPKAEAGKRCANCGMRGASLEPCGKGHDLCPDCIARCDTCGAVLCFACGATRCLACEGPDCANCGAEGARARNCEKGHPLCDDCTISCDTCGRPLCVVCGEYPCATCKSGVADAGA